MRTPEYTTVTPTANCKPDIIANKIGDIPLDNVLTYSGPAATAATM